MSIRDAFTHPPASWAVPAFLDEVNQPLTDADLVAAEAYLGVRLPAAYVALLRVQNGGNLRGGYDVSSRLAGIGPRSPSLTHDQAWWRPRNVESRPGAWAPEGAALLIPFDGDGHWDLCLDYRRAGANGEPAVTWVDLEGRFERPVAASFAAYLALLRDPAPEALRLRDVDAEQVARRLAEALGAAPPTVDALGLGYPVWRVALPGGEYRWAWCSPNRVATGFRREGSRLVLSDATALRFPETPECSATLEATEESRATIAALAASLGFRTV